MTDIQPEISVVIPIYNEEPNLHELYSRLVAVLEGTGRSFEIVTVDDGSTDGSLDILKSIRAKDDRVRIVRLARSFGQNPTTYAGFGHTRGRIVATVDADLQNPPEEIPKLIDKLEEGYEVVNGWRRNRSDSWPRVLASRVLNFIISRLSRVRLHDHGCALKVYRREVIDQLMQFTHHSRYLIADLTWLGVRIAEVEVEHRERAAGKGKYGFLDLLRVSFDLLSSISSVPLQIIGLIGWLFAFAGFGIGMWVGVYGLFLGVYNPFLILVALFFLIAGVQMIATGIMCEYISRIYIEAQGKPYYLVKEVIE